MNTGAVFSPCRQYRYALFRRWSDPGVPAVFIMLNPSTADEVVNDPTVERCERRARAMGFGALRVCNLFALRSTDPRALYDHANPVGPSNDATILELVKDAGIVICAWGKHGHLHDRGRIVHETLLMQGVVPYYLKLNKDGTPAHPLYIGYDVQPKLWEAE